MKMKKIGILAMALVLVLGLTGAAFASWTDDLTISGTVNTGSVGGSVVWVSGTWVYKVPELLPDEIVIQHEMGLAPGEVPTPPAGGELISYAAVTGYSEDANGAETVTVAFDKLFPVTDNLMYDFIVDILWHYDGSVPAKVNQIDNFVLNADQGTDPDLLAELNYTMSIFRCTEDGMPLGKDGNVLPWERLNEADWIEPGDQLHHCNYVMILIGVDVPQDNTLMNLSGSFTMSMDVIQWNEYGL